MSNVLTINGVERKIKRTREYHFHAWQTEGGEFVQTNTPRRKLWQDKGIANVEVTTVNLTLDSVIPGTDGDRDIVTQTIVGTRENVDKYLNIRTSSLKVEYTDTGAITTWTY